MVPVYAEGRDPWTLLDRTLMNRQLFEQLRADVQNYRLGRDLDMFALAGDASVGGEIARRREELSRFHGFFVLDAFAALRPFEGIDVNFNLTLLNPSASDSYRRSSEVLPGFAVHIQRDVATFGGHPVGLSFVALDLDVVTLGQGLLLEQTPLEGHMGSIRWNGFELRETFGGRVFWDDDDLLSISLSALNNHVTVQFVSWLQALNISQSRAGTGAVAQSSNAPRSAANYLTLSGHWSFAPNWNIAGEYGLRLKGRRGRHGGLLRIDYLNRNLGPLQLHLGYQARYYQRGIGPRDGLSTPQAVPNVPRREDAYVTNSFEYFGISQFFDQWSHTAMAEVRLNIFGSFWFLGEAEFWVRQSRDPRQGTKRVVYLPRGGRAPGLWTDVYFRLGLETRPWDDWPTNLSATVTNKRVAAGQSAVDPDERRFQDFVVAVLEVEVYL